MVMINDRTPLLPRNTQLGNFQDSSSRRSWKFWCKLGVAFFLVMCVGMGVGSWAKNSQKYDIQESKINRKISYSKYSSLDYLVVGDWGRKGLYNQSQVAIQMGKIGEWMGIEFVVSVGDNFYDTGLKGEDDPIFTTSFTNVYTAPSLQTMWYTVLGNHDYMGDAIAQLGDELVKRDPRWFCRRAFQLHRSLCTDPNEETCNASVDMFFIDTTPFIDEYWSPNATQTFDWRGLAPRANQLQSQLEDLATAINSSNATWKVVVGHHTIRSIGHHGDLPELVEQLLPVLEKYEADIYINGHDHNLQHIKRAESSVHLFTSGGGSKAYSGLRPYKEAEGVQFAYDGQGFLAVSMKAESVTLTFHDVFGDAIYTYSLQK